MSTERNNVKVAVYLILKKNKLALFLKRFNTGWSDGLYTLPAGHVEKYEGVIDAMIREAGEEIGIIINNKNIRVIHICHHIDSVEYIDFYLSVEDWQGEPKIMEPEKCNDITWLPLDKLPETVVPNVRSAVKNINKNEFFSEYRHEF